MVLANRRLTIDDVADELHISHGSAYEIIHDHLGFRKVCARWVPRQLTEDLKKRRVEACKQLLKRYRADTCAVPQCDVPGNGSYSFLQRIITGDETWVHHYEPESKRQSLQWKHPMSPPMKKFKTQSSVGKVLLTVFWDSQGVLLEHYSENGVTVTSSSYSELLQEKLKPAIRSKRRGLLSQGVLLLHDNARPHTALKTIETVQKLKFEVLQHPAYSPDLAPSDYHLFGPLKDNLRGRHFGTTNELKEAVHDFLHNQPKSFYSSGIEKLINRWTKCIDNAGDYVEK